MIHLLVAKTADMLRKDFYRILAYRQSGYILITALISLILLHYWVIYGSFRLSFIILVDALPPARDLPLPFKGQIGWAVGCLVLYIALPLITIKFLLKHRLSDYGWGFHYYWRTLPLYFVLYIPVAAAIFFVSKQPDFLNTYPFYHPQNWQQLVGWEIAYVLQFVGVEFFFRGFILLGISRYLGGAAAMVAMVFAYTMLHFTKPYLEASGAVIAGLVLGYLVIKTRSIWGGITVHSMVAVTMDMAALFRHGWFD